MLKRSLIELFAIGLFLAAVAFGLTACNGDDDPPPAPPAPAPLVPSVPSTTYSIGGTVTGATGPLTLQNSNGTTLAVPASGAFTFATEMVAGASYAVTVVVPPSSQTCTVTNGSGSVALADITNIAVACTNNPFTLGGTVSGLGAGKSVVLHAASDGVSGSFTASANGAFTFPLAFVDNAEWLVEVTTQPAGQTCTVAPDTGDISAASTNAIAVTCINSSASTRNWGAAATLAADADVQDGDRMRAPKVAFDAAGNALSIWEQDRDDAGGNEIYFSRFTAGGSWSAPAMIPNQAAQMPGQPFTATRRKPQLAVAANGNAVAAWVESVYSVAVSFYSPGSGWTNPERIYDNLVTGLGGNITPRVAMDASGNAVVVWENDMVNGVHSILYNRYTPGTGWAGTATTTRLINDLQFVAREPEIAMLPNGSTLVIWKQGGGGGFNQSQLWSSRYDMAGDTWSAPEEVDSQDSASPFYGRTVLGRTNLLMDAAGNATAVWAQYDGTRMHVVFNRLTGNTWGTPAIIESGNDTGLENAYDVRASIDGSGDIMAMWLQVDENDGHYVANRYVPGTGWGTQENIGQYVFVGHVANDTDFELASNAAGHTVAAWTLVSGIGPENVPEPIYLWANEYNPVNGSWGAPDVIDRNMAVEDENGMFGDSSSPAVAVDASGNAAAVWVNENGVDAGVRQNRFE